MIFGFRCRPGNCDVESGNDTPPCCSTGLSVSVECNVDEFLDDYVFRFPCFGGSKRENKTDGRERDRLLNGTNRAFVLIFGHNHPLRDCNVDLIDSHKLQLAIRRDMDLAHQV